MHAADAKIIGVHARPRYALIEDHQLFALFEPPERRGERADIHRLRRDVEEVREQPANLAKQHADELTTLGHLDAEEFLCRETEGMFLVHRRDIVEPMRNRGAPGDRSYTRSAFRCRRGNRDDTVIFPPNGGTQLQKSPSPRQ